MFTVDMYGDLPEDVCTYVGVCERRGLGVGCASCGFGGVVCEDFGCELRYTREMVRIWCAFGLRVPDLVDEFGKDGVVDEYGRAGVFGGSAVV